MNQIKGIKIIEPYSAILGPIDGARILGKLEQCARTCYKTEGKIKTGSAEKLLRSILSRKPVPHESVIEHESITVRFVGDRTMSHQLVRHRIASYSQESQRYCNYNKAGELEVIGPPSVVHGSPTAFSTWKWSVRLSYEVYQRLIEQGVPPEDARSVLPGCTKTEVVTTFNLRQWRHFFRLRCDSHAQWQIRGLALGVLAAFRGLVPVIFDDVGPDKINPKEVFPCRQM